MVMYGDSYCPTDYRRIYEAFADSGRLGLMTVFKNDNRWDKSNVEFHDGEIVNYDKKKMTPAMNFIDYGVGVFDAAPFEEWGEGSTFDLSTIQTSLLSRGQLAGLEVNERFYEIGSPEGLSETDVFLRSDRRARRSGNNGSEKETA